MRLNIAERACWTDRILPCITEYGIYLLAIFLFTDKGESFRSVGYYIPPLALIIRTYLVWKWPIDWRNPLLLSITAFCVSAIIASFFSTDQLAFFHEVRKSYFKAFLIFVVIASSFNKTESLKKLIILISTVSIFFIIMTFNDYVMNTNAFTSAGGFLFDNVRKYSPILAYCLPFIPFVLLTTKNKVAKGFWIVTLCMGVVALFLTGFRGGWISFGISTVIWSLWILYKRRSKITILIFSGIAIVVYIFLAVLPSHHITTKINMGLSSDRYEWIWQPYMQMYNDFPLANKIFGSGMSHEVMYKNQEQYRKEIKNYPFERYVPLNTHNNYLRILIRQGIVGFIMHINLLVVFVIFTVSAIRKREFFEEKTMGIAILCPFAGEYILRGLVEDLRVVPLGLLLGMAGAYMRLTKED